MGQTERIHDDFGRRWVGLIHYPTDHNGQLKLLTNIAEM
jgi:hypothetical protein